jgi:hypothetical protein
MWINLSCNLAHVTGLIFNVSWINLAGCYLVGWVDAGSCIHSPGIQSGNTLHFPFNSVPCLWALWRQLSYDFGEEIYAQVCLMPSRNAFQNFDDCDCCDCFFLQFTEGGRTRNSDEATVITTTITVVLFSTIVSSSNPLKIKNHFCSFKSCLSSGIPGSFSIYRLCNYTFLLPPKSWWAHKEVLVGDLLIGTSIPEVISILVKLLPITWHQRICCLCDARDTRLNSVHVQLRQIFVQRL